MMVTSSISTNLSKVTYNGDEINPKEDRPNLYLGIGLWSAVKKLSKALPIDVMQMLISATLMRQKIIEAYPEKSPSIVILIADSMAVREAERENAEPEKVRDVVEIYKKTLEPLLELLKIKNCTEVILSSDLERENKYQNSVELVKESENIKRIDEDHYNYALSQTAITHYMNRHKLVGVKVGWIRKDSLKHLSENNYQRLESWDELKFDKLYNNVIPDSGIQYLYAKAGLKVVKNNAREACPYTAYAEEGRYIAPTTILTLPKSISIHWKDVDKACLCLIEKKLAKEDLLPKNCLVKNNDRLTARNMLNYWLSLQKQEQKL